MSGRRILRLIRTPYPGKFWVVLGVAATIGLVIAHYAFPSGRFYVVEARTLAMTATVVGHRQSWRLPDAILCVAKPLDPRTLLDTTATDGLCPSTRYTREPPRLLEPTLPDGARLRLRLRPDDVLEIKPMGDTELTVAGATVDRRSFILLPAPAWRGMGVLTVAGDLRIGDDVAPASTHYLLEGRYEVRGEVLAYRVAEWFGAATRPIILKTGRLTRGDRVDLMAAEGRAAPAGVTRPVMQAFVTAPANADDAGLDLVAVSVPDRAELRVTSFASSPRHVAASWTDAAVRDPFILALTALLTVCALVVTIIVDVLQLGQEVAKPEPPAPPTGHRPRIRRRRRRS